MTTLGETFACLVTPGMVVVKDGYRFEVLDIASAGAKTKITFVDGYVGNGSEVTGLFDPYAVLAFEK